MIYRSRQADGRYELDDWRIRRDGSRFIANVIYTALVDGDGTLRVTQWCCVTSPSAS